MKTRILLAILLLFFIENGFSQKKFIQVTYVKGLKKLTDVSVSSPKILKGISYTLYATPNEASFTYNKKMNLNKGNKRFVGRGGGDGVYYKSLKNNIKLRQTISKLDNITYLISDRNYNWILTKEKKTINNYVCYKAIAKYSEFSVIRNKKIEYEKIAWYTPEIPMPFGPAGYDGLPGLVLIVKSGGYYFIAQKIKFQSGIDKLKLIKPRKGKKVTLKEYNVESNKYFKEKFGKDVFNRFKKKN